MEEQVNQFVSQTRPDISFDMLSVSCNMKNPTGSGLIEVNKIIENQYFQNQEQYLF